MSTEKNISGFSEQGLVALMSHSILTYSDFLIEIRRRIAAGETVHPYHAACAEVSA